MHGWMIRLPRPSRIGRRTLILLHGGSVWIMFGWAVYTAPIERFSRPGPDPLNIMDTPYAGVMWVACGVLAVACAALRPRLRGGDSVGFAGLVTPPIVWVVAYIWSAIAYVVTGGEAGSPRAGIGLLTWYLVSAFVLIVAGWPDPTDPSITEASEEPDEETER